MITAFRIVKQKFIPAAFSGEGARQFGGRWNPVGYPAVYTAESLALTGRIGTGKLCIKSGRTYNKKTADSGDEDVSWKMREPYAEMIGELIYARKTYTGITMSKQCYFIEENLNLFEHCCKREQDWGDINLN